MFPRITHIKYTLNRYGNIQRKEIKWKDGLASSSPEELPRGGGQGEAELLRSFAFAKQHAIMVRKSHALLRRLRRKAEKAQSTGWRSVPEEKGRSLLEWCFDTAVTDFLRVCHDLCLHTIDIDLLEVGLTGIDKCIAIASHLSHPCGGALVELSKELTARLQLVELAWDVAEVEEPKPLVREHRVFMRKYPNCLSGAELVNWLVVNNRAKDTDSARSLAQRLMEQVGLAPLDREKHDFDAGATSLYTFRAMVSLTATELQANGSVGERWAAGEGTPVSNNSGEPLPAKREGTMFVSPLEELDEEESEAGEGIESTRGEERECTVLLLHLCTPDCDLRAP